MSSSTLHGPDELTGALQEQGRVQEEIAAIQQTISLNEIWLRMNTPIADEYQDIVEELLAAVHSSSWSVLNPAVGIAA